MHYFKQRVSYQILKKWLFLPPCTYFCIILESPFYLYFNNPLSSYDEILYIVSMDIKESFVKILYYLISY